ncbi:hypothetical protein SEA_PAULODIABOLI_352 [Microbacterium phage PauloDiaboli]|nr:hypothetical protein SEA_PAULODIABOLI_352 [Microbacterium phage PauloDiaboli]
MSFINDINIFLHEKFRRPPRRPRQEVIMGWLIIGFFLWAFGGIAGLVALATVIQWYALIAAALWVFVLVLWFQFNTWYEKRYRP